MSREAKFRVWDKKQGKFIAEATLTATGFEMTDGYEIQESYDLVWMEYSELQDVNGKPIFEGDIIEWVIYPDENKPVKINGTVELSLGAFHIRERGELLSSITAYHRQPKVIGNLYTTPELLER